jgi:hypothetical protein
MDITIKEKFVLLCYHPRKGHNLIPAYIGYGIAGAMIFELAAMKKIKITDKRINLLDNKKTGDELLDGLIDMMSGVSRPYKVKTVIGKLRWKTGKLKRSILSELVRKRYLREERKRFLIFRYKRYPVANYSFRKNLLENIRRLVLRNIDSEEDIPLLAGLSGACRLSPRFFKGKEEKKLAGKRIKEIVRENQVDKVIEETIRAVEAAVAVSVATTAAAGSST